MKAVLFFMALFVSTAMYGLKITEVFYKGSPYVRSDERFIEIENDGDVPLDLSGLTVCVPKSGTETVELGVEKGVFGIRQDDVVTDSMVLPSGGFAVIMTEDYRKFAKLLSFSPGTLVLKPKNKSFSGWSWAGRVGLISLKTNGVPAFACGELEIPPDSAVPPGKSLSLTGGRYSVSEISPGENGDGSLFADSLLARGPVPVDITYFCPAENGNNVELSVFVNGSPAPPLTLMKVYDSVWKGRYYPAGLAHGDDVRFRYGAKTVMVRYLDKKPLSPDYHRLLFNELVTDPQTDYSGGGWTGSDGGGLIDSSDDWMELVNTWDSPVSVSNYYVLYGTENGESIKNLSVRFNPCYSKKSETVSNYNYIVMSPESGLADNASVALYDGYPWLDGRIVDELAYGDMEVTGYDPWLNAPSGKSAGKDDESVMRVPNAVFDRRTRDVFRKGRASFCGPNSEGKPLLWARNVTGFFTNAVFLTDFGNSNAFQEITLRNSIDEEKLVLTNYGIYFSGIVPVTNVDGSHSDGYLNVRNGMMNTVGYRTPDGSREIVTRFAWAMDGWQLPEETPDLARVLVYPNPVEQLKRTSLIFANLPDGAEISVLDPNGNVIQKLCNSEKGNGFVTWETGLKKGIYLAVVRAGNRTATKKILVR